MTTTVHPDEFVELCRRNLFSVVEFILRHGVFDVDCVTPSELERQRTPLSVAVACGSVETVELLLAYGADPNRTDIAGKSMFHKIVWNRLYGYGGTAKQARVLIQHLIAAGGDPTLKNDVCQQSAIEYAAEIAPDLVESLAGGGSATKGACRRQ